jgi:hypothetical protein
LPNFSTKTQIILNRCSEFLLISVHEVLWTYLTVNIKKKIYKKDKIISCDEPDERGILRSRCRENFLEYIYILYKLIKLEIYNANKPQVCSEEERAILFYKI